ncbi:site-specific integrase [Kibdelosporangium philippinense]|uniref:Site-specific integrase n=1 Tax=Kibdelosporangium philippinense TaxID=211113 RepID=A0ABS8ZWU5_9PSEU|nr:site-specific integrase [Kibdelosporangium philippinense]MCE7011515.1 site-specific integrase [Kibdelosporangium philippinense]
MSDKRRRFGRVRQLPSGRWQARYPGPDGQLRPAPTTFEREKDAEKWLNSVETDLERGDWTNPDAGKIPLGVYAKEWIAERPGLAVRTIELYEGLLRNHIDPHIGDVLLADLSARTVRKWRKALLESGVGEVTVAKAYRFLKAVMNTALDDDKLIKSNPCTIKKAGKEDSPERPIATIEQVLTAADKIQPRYRLVVLLAAFGSLRFAEMIGLQRQDFNLNACTVKVDRQSVQPDKGPMFEDDPKSAAGKRPIRLPAFLLSEIRTHLDVFVKPDETAWVFLGPKGARPKRNNFHGIWDKARRAAGIPDLHLHDLRHTGNTLAAETGATLRELMDRMGHGSTRAALIYLHAREERGQEIAAGIDQMVSRTKAKASKKTKKKGHARGTKPSGRKKDRPTETDREALTSGEEVERVTGIEPA